MKKIVNEFEKNGYVIVPGNLTLLKKIRLIIFKEIQKNKKINKNIDIEEQLNNFHKKINLKELNKLRFKIYNLINKDKKFGNFYYEIAKEYLNSLVGNELSMQKKINLSIQMPNDKDSLLDLHLTFMRESPCKIIVWIPLVDVYSTKSMFFTSQISIKK